MTYRKLTDLLAELPPEHAYTYRRKLLHALRLGLIDMVPAPGTATLTRPDKHGRPVPWDVQEHLVHDSPQFRTWHDREVADWTANRAASSALRGLVVTEDALARGDVDFAEMARRYRERLTPTGKGRGRGKKRSKRALNTSTEAVLGEGGSSGGENP